MFVQVLLQWSWERDFVLSCPAVSAMFWRDCLFCDPDSAMLEWAFLGSFGFVCTRICFWQIYCIFLNSKFPCWIACALVSELIDWLIDCWIFIFSCWISFWHKKLLQIARRLLMDFRICVKFATTKTWIFLKICNNKNMNLFDDFCNNKMWICFIIFATKKTWIHLMICNNKT